MTGKYKRCEESLAELSQRFKYLSYAEQVRFGEYKQRRIHFVIYYSLS